MKKILVPFDGESISPAPLNFAKKLNELEPISVTGIFLPDFDYPADYAFTGVDLPEWPVLNTTTEKLDSAKTQENIILFKQECEKNGLFHQVRVYPEGFPLSHIQKEALFADLLIISNHFFHKSEDMDAQEYVKLICHHVNCPIIVIPEDFDFIQTVVLAYNGSASSVFAIKQFIYLFPELRDAKTLLVYANSSQEKEFPSEDYIREWATCHFNNISFCNLQTETKGDFDHWLEQNRKSLLITGAYDRSTFSEFFSKSFLENTIREQHIPVFISHK